MILECSTEKLKQALGYAERMTGKNLSLPILGSLLFIASGKSLRIRATNLSLGIEIEVPAKIEQEGVLAVKADTVSAAVHSFVSNENVTLSLDNGNLLLKTKQNKVLVKAYSHEDFPTLPVVAGQEIYLSAKKLIEGLKSVVYSASVSDIKPELASVYVYPSDGQIFFVATDAFRLAEKKIKGNEGEWKGILIPAKNALEIIKLFQDYGDDIKIIISDNQLSLTTSMMYVTSRLVANPFPDYTQILPKEPKTQVTVLKQDLVNALKLTTVFSDKFNQVTINVVGADKKMAIGAKNADTGEQITKVDAAISGEDIEMNVNYRHMMDCFQSIGQDSITLSFTDTNRPVVIRGVSDQSFLYLIMPMNR